MPQGKARPVVAFIPPACCGAGYFRRLARAFDGSITFRPVELPGRGRRYQEPCITQADLAARDITRRLVGPVDAIYGESLGAYLALATADQAYSPLLFVASNTPPCARESISAGEVATMGTAIAGLAALGGDIPTEVTQDPYLVDRAFPLVRDDLLLSWSLIDALRDAKTVADVQVIGGEEDTRLHSLESWASHTTGQCDVVRLPGGHLLSAVNPSGVAQVVLETLR